MAALETSTPVAVLGAGAMGAGIAQVAATAGHPVLLFDINPDATENGIGKLRAGLDKLVSREKMTQEDCDALLARIQPCNELQNLTGAGLIIEAIVEKLEVKQKVFAELESICDSGTILATNTSSISVTAIGAALEQPGNLVGMHFFNPAPILKLVEVISGEATDAAVAQRVHDTAKNWGKTPVFARSTPGFIVNRVARPFYAEALRILEEGAADIGTIDDILRDCGNFRMGPFELMDLIGHDVNYAVTCSVYNAYYQDPRFKPSLTQLELVNAGYLGRKTGRGFYDYSADGTKTGATQEPAQPAPATATYSGDLGVACDLLKLAGSADIYVEQVDAGHPGTLSLDGVTVALTDGRSATERAFVDNIDKLVLFDLAFDFQASSRIVLAAADQCSSAALVKVSGFFQALGKQVTLIDDIPGMVVMRTVAMLANEAADVVHQNIASAEDVDAAIKYGVNYPRGPLCWGDLIGTGYLFEVLCNLLGSYGEDRYRVSQLIRRKAFTNKSFL